jgi:tetratricopeptide (TPR) repeat protein
VPEPVNLPEPRTADEYVERARVRNSRGDRAGAQIDVEKALSLEPDHLAALTDKAAYSAADLGILLCERVIGMKADYAPAYHVLANHYYQTGNRDEAIRLAGKAVEFDPTQARYFLNLGFYLSIAKQQEPALEAYAKALALDAFMPLTYTNRAAIYIDLKRFPEAMEDLSKAIDLDPLHPEAWINRAVTRREMGNFNGALDDASRAMELAPGHPWAVHLRGIVYHDLKRDNEALADLNLVLPSNEHWFAETYPTRAEVKLALGDKAGAIADYRRYLQLTPEAEDRAEIEAKIAELEK